MTKRQIMDKIPFKLLAVFLLLAAGISAGGFVFYKQQRAKSVAHIQEDLNTIAQLKSEEITAWRRERYGDAYVLSKSSVFVGLVKKWFASQGDATLRKQIQGRLESFKIYGNYDGVYLIDASGKIRLAVSPEKVEILGVKTLDLIRQAADSNKILFSDFYFCRECRHDHLDIIAPLLSGRSLTGFIIFRVNPHVFLYPLIQSWPTVSRSGETLILHLHHKDNVVHILNELRFQKTAEAKIILPATDTLLVEIMASREKTGMVEGLDYRGIPVLAAIKHIENSPWFMVAKMDKEEIYAPLKRQAVNVAVLVFLLIILLAAVLSFIWQADRRGFYEKQYQLELDKQALVKHFDYLTKYANDIIFLADENYRLVEANDRAVQVYGYSREELIGKYASDLRPEGARSKFKSQMEEMISRGGMVFETVQARKDGSTFPVEVSARPLEIEDKRYLQAIIRDISERKQYELDIKERNAQLEAANQELMASEEELKAADEELRHNMVELEKSHASLQESEAKLQLTLHQAAIGIAAVGLNKRFLNCNKAFCEFIGYSEEELQQKTIADITYPEDIEIGMADLRAIAAGQMKTSNVVKRYVRKDGAVVWGEVRINLLRDDKGQPLYFLPVIQDITERKQAEEKIRFQADIIDNSPIIAAYHDKDLNVVWVNKAYQKATGLNLEDIKGKKCYQVWNLAGPCRGCPVITAIETGKSAASELTPDNQDHWPETQGSWLSEAAPIRNEEGTVIGAIEFALNITERKQAEEKIQKQLAELQRWQGTMLDREDRVIDLKREVNEILARQGQPKKYGGG